MLLVYIFVRVLNSSLLVRVCCIELYHRKSLSGLDGIMAYGLIVFHSLYGMIYFALPTCIFYCTGAIYLC